MGVIEPTTLALRLGVAALCAGIVGLERELRNKPAGLRTIMLVGIGSCVFALIAVEIGQGQELEGHAISGDVGRILQGAIGGIGVLGAGVFLHRPSGIGLATTGASVWLIGGVGLASGLGLYVLAGAATVLALVVLEVLAFIVERSSRS